MSVNLFIALRYLFTKRKEKFISLISIISIFGVAIGVMALIVVIAVMSGFDNDLRDKIIGNYSHLTVFGLSGIQENDARSLSGIISSNKNVSAVSPYVQGQILLKENNKFFAVGIKGIDPKLESNTTKIEKYLLSGSINDLGENSIFIGRELAEILGLVPGSEVLAYSPLGKEYKLKVSGVFFSGMYDYDMNLVFTNLKTSQEILGMKDKISAIAVKLHNVYEADKVKQELSKIIGFDYGIKTWTEANQNFFAALKLEKFAMFIILALIILVASFNIISTLIVLVVEKTKDVGVLKALGFKSEDIRKIFSYHGLIIGVSGIVLGLIGGLFLCFLVEKYQFIKLPQDIYYLDHLPIRIDWMDMALIIVAALIITVLSTIYPAIKAAHLKPVEALRYE